MTSLRVTSATTATTNAEAKGMIASQTMTHPTTSQKDTLHLVESTFPSGGYQTNAITILQGKSVEHKAYSK